MAPSQPRTPKHGRRARAYDIIDERRYVLTRKLEPVDEVLLGFCHAVAEHCPYAVTRGGRALLMGRVDDVDNFQVLIPRMEEDEFCALFEALLDKGYWDVSGEDWHAAFTLLSDEMGVRFAVEKEVEPTLTLMFVSSPDEQELLDSRIELATDKGPLFIAKEPPTEPPKDAE